MRLAQTHPEWALGFQDEVWWSRAAQPRRRTWAEADAPLRLLELAAAKADPDPKALAYYGLLVRRPGRPTAPERMLLRFVDGRPVSAVTLDFLKWSCQSLARPRVKVLALIWDNAP